MSYPVLPRASGRQRPGIAICRPDHAGQGSPACAGGRFRDALVHVGRKRADPARRQIDVQEHQFLRRGPRWPAWGPSSANISWPRCMRFVVDRDDLRRDPHPRPDQQLALIEVVRLGDKGSELAVAAVIEPEPQFVEQQIGRLVEQHRVIGKVHVPVIVDPFGQDLAAKPVERGGKAHRDGSSTTSRALLAGSTRRGRAPTQARGRRTAASGELSVQAAPAIASAARVCYNPPAREAAGSARRHGLPCRR